MKIIKKLCLMILGILFFSLISFSSSMAIEINEGGTLIAHMASTPDSLWPVTATDRTASPLFELAYNQLIGYDENNKLIPQLAKSWDISEDGLTYTFYLREDVKFHDGHPFTAKDVEFTYTLLGNKKAVSLFFAKVGPIKGTKEYYDGKVKKISGIQIVDDHTIKFTLNQRNVAFLSGLQFPILPEHIFNKISIEELSVCSESQKLIGTGPFRLVRYVTDQYYEFKRFDDYWQGRPHIEKIYVKLVKDDVAIAMLEKGDIDYIQEFPASELDYVKLLPDIKIMSIANTTWPWMFRINTKKPYLNDKRVRQAFMYAIDRQGFVDSVMQGYGTVYNFPNTNAKWAWPDLSEIKQYPYNPEKAKALLKEVGWDSDQVVQILYYPGNKARDSFAVIAQQMLKEVGVKVDVISMDVARANIPYHNGDYDMLLSGGSAQVEPDYQSMYFESSKFYPIGDNTVYYANKRVDELLEEGRSTFDFAKRTEIYKEINKILNEDVPWIYLIEPNHLSVINKRVKDVDYNPNIVPFRDPARFLNIHKWWLEK